MTAPDPSGPFEGILDPEHPQLLDELFTLRRYSFGRGEWIEWTINSELPLWLTWILQYAAAEGIAFLDVKRGAYRWQATARRDKPSDLEPLR